MSKSKKTGKLLNDAALESLVLHRLQKWVPQGSEESKLLAQFCATMALSDEATWKEEVQGEVQSFLNQDTAEFVEWLDSARWQDDMQAKFGKAALRLKERELDEASGAIKMEQVDPPEEKQPQPQPQQQQQQQSANFVGQPLPQSNFGQRNSIKNFVLKWETVDDAEQGASSSGPHFHNTSTKGAGNGKGNNRKRFHENGGGKNSKNNKPNGRNNDHFDNRSTTSGGVQKNEGGNADGNNNGPRIKISPAVAVTKYDYVKDEYQNLILDNTTSTDRAEFRKELDERRKKMLDQNTKLLQRVLVKLNEPNNTEKQKEQLVGMISKIKSHMAAAKPSTNPLSLDPPDLPEM